MPPSGIPVGVITAFLGAPFFLVLLRRKKSAVF
jgi:ABC-type Fe3+-siderophore transport system permease subunit